MCICYVENLDAKEIIYSGLEYSRTANYRIKFQTY